MDTPSLEMEDQVTDLVIFDCDGVLVDSEPLSVKATVIALAEYGVQLDVQQVLRSLTGLTFTAAVAKVRRDYGVELPVGYARRHAQLVDQMFRQELRPMAGVRQTLGDLGERGIPFCVASNSSQARLALTFKVTGLGPFFEGRVFSGEDVKEGKPAPDLFLHAAASCGVSPRHCLVVEDSPVGVTAAVKAGMPVIGFAGGGHASPALCERLLQAGASSIIDDFRQIPQALRAPQGLPALR